MGPIHHDKQLSPIVIYNDREIEMGMEDIKDRLKALKERCSQLQHENAMIIISNKDDENEIIIIKNQIQKIENMKKDILEHLKMLEIRMDVMRYNLCVLYN